MGASSSKNLEKPSQINQIIEEGKIKGAIDSVPIEKLEKILYQMKNCVCKVIGIKVGTGFFCKIFYQNKLIPVLMTNFHIIDDNFIETKSRLDLYINENLKRISINKNSKIYSSIKEEYDVMIIKLNEEDEINNFLELDNNIFIDKSEESYNEHSIYILHHPNGYNISVSYGYGIEKDNKYSIKHKCNTDFCSSGGPILSLLTNKIIGLHKGVIIKSKNSPKENSYNIGTYLQYPLIELYKTEIKDNQIKNNINLNENDINKKLNSLYSCIKNTGKEKENEEEEEKEEEPEDVDEEPEDVDEEPSEIEIPSVYSNSLKSSIVSLESEKSETKEPEVASSSIENSENSFTSKKEKNINPKENIPPKPELESEENNIVLISINVKNSDVNKEIYFLDNTNGEKDINGKEHYHDNLKELNSLNTKLYINNIKNEYQKYFKPKHKGIYKIKLKLNISITDFGFMFFNCKNIIKIDSFSIDTNNITNMECMFYGCSSLKSLPDISKWNTKNTDNMRCMFYECSSLKSLPDISKWNTTSVYIINQMFCKCSSLQSLPDISQWKITNLKYMRCLFYGCKSLKCIPDISQWDIKKVESIWGMFYECESIESLPNIAKWKTNNINNMKSLFNKCQSLISLPDIGNWVTTKVTDMNHMFFRCRSLISIPDLSKWNTKNVKSMDYMFSECVSLTSRPDIHINYNTTTKGIFFG